MAQHTACCKRVTAVRESLVDWRSDSRATFPENVMDLPHPAANFDTLALLIPLSRRRLPIR
ncbi:MAG TPA: hypothetical protein VK753_05825 [Xanthomonadaceae bacterium]|jgi:hypothetical protein|nr:hypothetical protein [Xanthomonadaceae bacterium]